MPKQQQPQQQEQQEQQQQERERKESHIASHYLDALVATVEAMAVVKVPTAGATGHIAKPHRALRNAIAIDAVEQGFAPRTFLDNFLPERFSHSDLERPSPYAVPLCVHNACHEAAKHLLMDASEVARIVTDRFGEHAFASH